MWASTLGLSAGGPVLLPILLDGAIKGVAILSLTALATLAMRRSSAAARHLVWFLGTLSLLILPLLSAALPGWYILPRWTMNTPVPVQQSAVTTLSPAPAIVPARPDVQLLPNYTPPQAKIFAPTPAPFAPTLPALPASSPLPLTWQAWILLTWLTGTLLLLAHVTLGFLSLCWLGHRSSRITAGHWPTLLRQLSNQLGLRRPVELLTSPSRTTPMTWGLWRTRLLLPEDSATWTPDQRRAVLLHELAHARRWDCLTQLVVQIVCALYWFNPLVWLAWHRIQTERERACDDLVLSTGTKPSAYAEQLLHIAADMPAVRYSAAAIAMARPSSLEGRLLAILDVRQNRRAVTKTLISLAVVALLTVTASLAALRTSDDSMQNNTRFEKIAPLQVISASNKDGGEVVASLPKWSCDIGLGVYDLYFTPDGRYLIVSDREGVRLLDARMGHKVKKFEMSENVMSVGCSRDSREIIGGALLSRQIGNTGAGVAVVKVWDIHTGKLLREFDTKKQMATSVGVSRDGSRLSAAVADKGQGNKVRIWDVQRETEIATIQSPSGMGYQVDLSNDGRRIVAMKSDGIASRGEDFRSRVWDAQTGKELCRLDTSWQPSFPAAFSPDGRRVMLASGVREAALFDTDSGKRLLAIEPEFVEQCFMAVAISPDGRWAASGGMPSRIWDLATGKCLVKLSAVPSTEMLKIAVSPDGRCVAAAGGKKVHLWQVATGGSTQPAVPLPVIAKLPNGVAIEFHGIAPSPANAEAVVAPPANAWFSPKGISVAAPYTSLEANFRELDAINRKSVTEYIRTLRSPNPYEDPYEFAFTLHDLQDSNQPAYQIIPSDQAIYPAVYKWQRDGSSWWTHTTLITRLLKGIPNDRVNIRVTLSSGPFQTRAVVPVDRATTLTLDNSPIILQRSVDFGGHARFNTEYDAKVHYVKLFAVSHSGRVYRNASNAGGSEGPADDPVHPGFQRDVHDLIEPPLKDIAYLILQTRSVCWAEIRNVPLKPGLADTLEIATSPTPVRPVDQRAVESRVYDISPFISSAATRPYQREEAVQDIITIIQAIEPDSWRDNDGSLGTLTRSATSLAITTTPTVHDQIAVALAQLTPLRPATPAATQAAVVPTSTTQPATQPADADEPYRQLYTRYKDTILKAAQDGDAKQVEKLTDQFNEAIAGRLVSAKVERLGPPDKFTLVLHKQFWSGSPSELPKISYNAGDAIHVSHTVIHTGDNVTFDNVTVEKTLDGFLHIRLDLKPLPVAVPVFNQFASTKQPENKPAATQRAASLTAPATVPPPATRPATQPWEPMGSINADFAGAEATYGGTFTVTGTGQDAQGQAIINCVCKAQNAGTTEYDVIAVTKDGRKLGRRGVSSKSIGDLVMTQFTFGTPLADLKTFFIRSRPAAANRGSQSTSQPVT